jgi:lysozyme
MISSELLEQLKRHEGFRQFPYKCSQGFLTVGYGRNLDSVGVNEDEALGMLLHDAYKAVRLLDNYKWFSALDEVRQDALINFMFNVGPGTFAKFKKMIAALEDRDYNEAAAQLLDSRYAQQVGKRAQEVAQMLRTGERPNIL